MKKHKNWLKGAAVALALTLTLPLGVPVPVQAATKKVTVSVKSPKSGVKLSGSKLTIHSRKAVQLTVKSGKSNITSKVSLKSSSPKVISVRGAISTKEERQSHRDSEVQGYCKETEYCRGGS